MALFFPLSPVLMVMESSLPPVYPQEESVGTCVWLWGPGLCLLQRVFFSITNPSSIYLTPVNVPTAYGEYHESPCECVCSDLG